MRQFDAIACLDITASMIRKSGKRMRAAASSSDEPQSATRLVRTKGHCASQEFLMVVRCREELEKWKRWRSERRQNTKPHPS